MDLAVPRDRAGSFDPRIVRKGQSRLDGFNGRIIALYAPRHDHPGHPRAPAGALRRRRLPGPDLSGHRRGGRGADRVVVEAAGRRVYPVVFIDALMVKIRDGVVANRP